MLKLMSGRRNREPEIDPRVILISELPVSMVTKISHFKFGKFGTDSK